VAARSKEWTCDHLLAGIGGFSSAGGRGCLFVGNVVCRQVEVSATVRSLVQGSPTERGASECDREVSILMKTKPTKSVEL